MSTKIHNGYRLAPGTDVFDFSARLREVMNPVRDLLDARFLMRAAVQQVDAADINGRPRPSMPLWKALNAYDDLQAKTTPESRLHDPHRFEVTFGRDPVTGRVLARPYTDQPEFTAAWLALPEVEPYGYWNNTDPEDGVSAEEWAERGRAWERVMPGNEPPIETMLSFVLRAAPGSGMVRFISAADEHRGLLLAHPLTVRERAAHATRMLVASVARESHDDSPQVLRLAAQAAPVHLVDMVEPLLDPNAAEAALEMSLEERPAREVDTSVVGEAISAWLAGQV